MAILQLRIIILLGNFTLKKNYCILAAVFLALTMTHSFSFANDKEHNYSVPPFPPFNHFDEYNQCKGVGVLAVEKVTINLAEKFTEADFPYARILNSLKTGQLDVAFLFKNNTVIKDIEYVGPLSMSKIVVISQPDIVIQHYKDVYQFKSIAVIRNAQFNNKFDQDKQLNKVNVSSYRQAVRLLKLQRVNAVIGSKVGLEYALHQEKLNEKIIANAFYLDEKESGLHISKKSPLINILPRIKASVKQAYKRDLVEQLYTQQMSQCASLK